MTEEANRVSDEAYMKTTETVNKINNTTVP